MPDRALGWVRSVPRAVWAICGCYLALLFCYALLYPPYLGFDEPQHVDMTVALRHDPLRWPDPGERVMSEGVARSSDAITRSVPAPKIGPYAASAVPSRADRPTLVDLGGNQPSTTPGRLPNQMVQHPPLHYALGAFALAVLPRSESLAYDQVVGLLRLLCVLMTAPLPLLCWAATHRLTGSAQTAAAAAAVPLGVPGLARNGASFNNDNLLVPLIGLLTVLLVRIMTGDVRRRTGLLAGLTLGAALLTKGTALPLVPLVPLAYAVAWRRHRQPFPWQPALAALGASALGGWWWLRNLVVYGVVQVNGLGSTAPLAEAGAPPGPHRLGTWLRFVEGGYDWRFWSALGYIDSPGLPFRLARALTLAVLVVVGVALVRTRRDRPVLAVLLLPLLLSSVVLGLTSWLHFRRTGVVAAIQARYVYSGVTGLAVVVAVGLTALAERGRRWLPLGVLVGALALQATAIHAVLIGLWVPPGSAAGTGRYLAAGRAVAGWSPWPGAVTGAVFASAAGLTVIAVSATVATALRPEPKEAVAGGSAPGRPHPRRGRLRSWRSATPRQR